MACSTQRNHTKFTPTNPHFFKIFLGQTLANAALQIPMTFWKKYSGSLPSQVFLKLPSGSRWEVGLTKSDGNVWIEKGWSKFVEHCSLSRGNLLVFQYEGNSEFNVVIFDRTTVEIDYPLNPNHFEKHGIPIKESHSHVGDDDEDDVSIEVLSSYPKTKDKSPLQCSRPNKKRKTSPHGKSEVKLNTPDQVYRESSQPSWMTPEYFISRQKLSEQEKDAALKRAKGFKSNDPFFTVSMQPCCVADKPYMLVPALFAKKYLLNKIQEVIFKVQDGRTWSVKCFFRRTKGDSTKITFERGWKAFARDNELKVDDVCAFVLRNSTGMALFEVVIFGENGVAKSPMVSGTKRRATTNRRVKVGSSFNCGKTRMISQNQMAKKEQEKIKVEPIDQSMEEISEAKTGNQGSSKRPSSSGDSRASVAASQFLSKNPYFKVVLLKYHAHAHRLPVPITFVRKYLKEKAQIVTLWVGKEHWQVKLLDKNHIFSAGWAAFATDNSLQPRDVCIFELIHRNPPEMKVTIFRQSGLAHE